MEPKHEPYWGSVRFFKHTILFIAALLILIPTALSVFFAHQSIQLQNRLLEAEKTLLTLSQTASVEQEEGESFDDSPQPPELPDYQALYPTLYAQEGERSTLLLEKYVYLTFDDGPSPRTPELLSILADYDVTATFFVTGQESEAEQQWMRDIVAAGHAIGVHSYTHDYHSIYQSVDSYLADFSKVYELVYRATGVYPQIFRFPGGSVNGFNSTTYQEIISEMVRRGFVYFDWNTITGDAENGSPSPQRLQENALSRVNRLYRSILLMHDGEANRNTVTALPGIIEGYRDAGFQFAPLSPQVVPVVFSYPD